MKACKITLVWLALTAMLGCSSPDIGPAGQSNAGFVDFYTGSSDIALEIREKQGGKTETLFSNLQPLDTGVVRIETSPGPHQFQVLVLNRVTDKPAVVDLNAVAGQVVPVRLTLQPMQEISVEEKKGSARKNLYGHYGARVTTSGESVMYVIKATVQPAQALGPAAPMSYAPR